ncbi:CBS domain-containing protein [Bradyrhizobium sp. A5]
MRALHVMTRDVVAVTPHTTIEEAAKVMLQMHFSGLPAGSLLHLDSR